MHNFKTHFLPVLCPKMFIVTYRNLKLVSGLQKALDNEELEKISQQITTVLKH